MDQTDIRSKLLDIIRERAILHGEFTLRSGEISNVYVDLRLVTLDAQASNLIGQILLDIIQREDIDAVGGPTIGADPIVGATLAVAGQEGTQLAGFLVRSTAKDHGTGKMVEGPLKEGSRVLIVEDTVTTAGAPLKAAKEVERLGCKVARIVPIVDRLASARENVEKAGYLFDPIFTIRDLGLAD